MMWSSVTIPGKPTILVVNASQDVEGWESDFCRRLFGALQRRGLQMLGDGPVELRSPEDLFQPGLQEHTIVSSYSLMQEQLTKLLTPS